MAGCLPLSQWLSTPARSLMSDPTRSQSRAQSGPWLLPTPWLRCAQGVICLLGQTCLVCFVRGLLQRKDLATPGRATLSLSLHKGPSRIPLTIFTGCGVAGGLEQTWCGGTGTLQASSLSMSLPLRRAIGTPGALRG